MAETKHIVLVPAQWENKLEKTSDDACSVIQGSDNSQEETPVNAKMNRVRTN